ncbi:MAG: UDP-N-acetylmuramate--L-alanine ligase [Marinifilaceae bacterium]
MKNKIHFIAIGGSAMHNLALALHEKGFEVTGSDDEIFEPSRSRLEKAGILPKQWGWFPEKITTDIEAVILGMHARIDNPELVRARELGLKIYSYPEYLFEQTKNKQRIIIGGSHGKTTTTSMIMHVLKQCNRNFDYMVGASVEGFDTMVHLSEESPIAVFEGDEYLTSPLELTPKFHHYYPDIAIITGIAWDHMNVFPTFENYVSQFRIFTERITSNGTLIYFEKDDELQQLSTTLREDIHSIPYNTLPYVIENGTTYIILDNVKYALNIFGLHNIQNLTAAYYACKQVGISDSEFGNAISSYSGAAKRLQTIAVNGDSKAFLDFAHSPSKLQATLNAVRQQYPHHHLVACMELHTFSSLNAAFLPQYANSMSSADIACVYYNPEVIKHKQLPDISIADVRNGFAQQDLNVFTDNKLMEEFLYTNKQEKQILLIMTSGNFHGINIPMLANELIK